MLDYYHSLYDKDHKEFLQSKIEDFAVEQNFVTEFTSLVVVQSDQPRNRRGAQKIGKPLLNLNVQVKKKRSLEKKEQIQAMKSKFGEIQAFIEQFFEQYNQPEIQSINTLDSQSDDAIVKQDIVRPLFENSQSSKVDVAARPASK